MPSRFSTIEDAVDAIRDGRVVIVVDAEDRENEGDFVCAAEKATPETVNFMITYGRGQLCMPILPEVSQRLELPSDGRGEHGAARHQLHRAGRSPLDAAPASPPPNGLDDDPRDLRSRRARRPISTGRDTCSRSWPRKAACCAAPGHTEAAVDLARMAGLMPAGVLCEILDDTGDRANRDRAARSWPASSTCRSFRSSS